MASTQIHNTSVTGVPAEIIIKIVKEIAGNSNGLLYKISNTLRPFRKVLKANEVSLLKQNFRTTISSVEQVLFVALYKAPETFTDINAREVFIGLTWYSQQPTRDASEFDFSAIDSLKDMLALTSLRRDMYRLAPSVAIAIKRFAWPLIFPSRAMQVLIAQTEGNGAPRLSEAGAILLNNMSSDPNTVYRQPALMVAILAVVLFTRLTAFPVLGVTSSTILGFDGSVEQFTPDDMKFVNYNRKREGKTFEGVAAEWVRMVVGQVEIYGGCAGAVNLFDIFLEMKASGNVEEDILEKIDEVAQFDLFGHQLSY